MGISKFAGAACICLAMALGSANTASADHPSYLILRTPAANSAHHPTYGYSPGNGYAATTCTHTPMVGLALNNGNTGHEALASTKATRSGQPNRAKQPCATACSQAVRTRRVVFPWNSPFHKGRIECLPYQRSALLASKQWHTFLSSRTELLSKFESCLKNNCVNPPPALQ